MKNFFEFFGKLCLTGLLLFTVACGQKDDTDPIMELNDLLEIQFEVKTFEPVIGEETVELSGDVTKILPNHSIQYGFMWSLDKKCPEPDEMGFLIVNEGVFTGRYELMTADMPKGKDLLVCAYLISSTDKRIRIVGEEFKLKL